MRRHCLLAAADAEDWLRCGANHMKGSSQRFDRILVPGMTLATEDDVRRTECLNEFRRDVRKWLSYNPQVGLDPLQGRANLARARALAFDGVVD